MLSFHTSLVAKAHRYAEEPRRARLGSMHLWMDGDNATHTVVLDGDVLSCDCDHFTYEGICAHVVAVERLLAPHLPEGAVRSPMLAVTA